VKKAITYHLTSVCFENGKDHMKRTIGDYLILLLIIGIIAFFSGCTSFGPSKPNIPFAGNPYPSILNNLYQNNPLLAEELGKLPELQDGISINENYALEKLIKLYGENPNAFYKVFEEMYQIGNPGVRKYCSPLQALFWLAEDGKLDDAKDILKDYSPEKLLGTAWSFQPRPILFSEEQISMIIDNMKDKRMQELFFKNKNDKERIQGIINFHYKHSPRIFEPKARVIIKEAKSENEDLRWEDFNLVTDRLNSPELLDYYERHVISYKYQSGYGEGPEEARRVFNNKFGHCAQVTAFTVYVLRKASYEARRYIVSDPMLKSPRGNYHRATLFIAKGKKYIMDNGRGYPKGIERFEDYGDSASRKKDARLQGEPMLYTR